MKRTGFEQFLYYFIIIVMNAPIKNVALNEENYPLLLKEIADPPAALHYMGELPRPETKMIAIVGTRKLTPEGKIIAKQIAKDLAESGLTIVSGLALGIDAAAHEGALMSGRTVAVLANGLDKIYPPSNENLAKEIIEKGGAIISEYPAGTPAYPSQFLARNRIISGLALATVIVEMPRRSGASVTAKQALEQDREIFVVPGSIRHANYQGSHMLIRNGARLVTSAQDILEDLDLAPEAEGTAPRHSNDPTAENILNALQNAGAPLDIDNISEITKLEPQAISRELTYLLIDGIITEKNNKFFLKK
ncbi:MAG: hypothetical protein UY23_C0006G0040 [Candidatus Jorgensenbacteria bacterium GW2011_GWA1_48_11]|uniref:Uncharacterized protein n=1 Tax=Candidatus Jorgensenbacteria bacterium GW2011_GWA1_48_11 TaxID=1618660 RepID=A0A0G1U9K7_9BACT|nr:MAG: hypothetical protein UY23_C0006G0040 [Candidatus Jorgensenbacteria bacterium GW2011_GWA1_48_11]